MVDNLWLYRQVGFIFFWKVWVFLGEGISRQSELGIPFGPEVPFVLDRWLNPG